MCFDVASCVENVVVGVSVCICDKSYSSVLSYLYLVEMVRELKRSVGYMRAGRMVALYSLSLL